MKRQSYQSRSREIVFCALSIAFITVCAWVSIPLGPIPFTLSTFALLFVLFTLKSRSALVSIMGYVVLGGLGLPVFSSFKGGLAALLGPTGGFIVGFVVAAVCAIAVGKLLERALLSSHEDADDKQTSFFGQRIARATLVQRLAEGVVFLVVLYVFGWIWLMVSANIDPLAAFLSAVAPFMVIDFIKMLAAVLLSQAVSAAVGARSSRKVAQ